MSRQSRTGQGRPGQDRTGQYGLYRCFTRTAEQFCKTMLRPSELVTKLAVARQRRSWSSSMQPGVADASEQSLVAYSGLV